MTENIFWHSRSRENFSESSARASDRKIAHAMSCVSCFLDFFFLNSWTAFPLCIWLVTSSWTSKLFSGALELFYRKYESNSEFNRESLNFQHSLCLDNVTQRSNRQAQEKIPCYGEFTQRSDPWAGLIASCGSFYPMVHHSAAHSLDTSLTCGTSLWLIFGCPDYFLRNGVHISAGPEEVNRKELASVKPSARKWEWEKRRPENQPSNSGSTVHQIKS